MALDPDVPAEDTLAGREADATGDNTVDTKVDRPADSQGGREASPGGSGRSPCSRPSTAAARTASGRPPSTRSMARGRSSTAAGDTGAVGTSAGAGAGVGSSTGATGISSPAGRGTSEVEAAGSSRGCRGTSGARSTTTDRTDNSQVESSMVMCSPRENRAADISVGDKMGDISTTWDNKIGNTSVADNRAGDASAGDNRTGDILAGDNKTGDTLAAVGNKKMGYTSGGSRVAEADNS